MEPSRETEGGPKEVNSKTQAPTGQGGKGALQREAFLST